MLTDGAREAEHETSPPQQSGASHIGGSSVQFGCRLRFAFKVCRICLTQALRVTLSLVLYNLTSGLPIPDLDGKTGLKRGYI